MVDTTATNHAGSNAAFWREATAERRAV